MNEQTRRSLYLMFIVVAVAMAAGRVLGVVMVYEPDIHRPDNASAEDTRRIWPKSRPEPMPTFSSNDRSRWATVRALVDDGTYIVGKRDPQTLFSSAAAAFAARDPLQAALLQEAGFRARVASDRGIVFEDGWQSVDKVLHPSRLEFYSTKPPLLSTMVAGEYWLLKQLFGWSFQENRWEIVRVVLFTINLLPFGLYLWLLARLIDRYTSSDWARFFLVASACFATLVTPFLITLNNHSIAVVAVTVALFAALQILERGKVSAGWFLLAGLASGFTICNELPAAAFAGGLFVLLLLHAPTRTLLLFAPAMLVPLLALVLVNWIALGQLRPAYSEFGGPWYEYEGSHWRVTEGVARHGIDWAGRNGESKPVYAFHLLLGHHGVFSLTPVFLLALAGLLIGLFRKSKGVAHETQTQPQFPPLFYPFCLVVSVILIGFYIYKTDNYGGWSNGPRWLIWLTPLWILGAIPAVEWLGRRSWGRWLCLLFLALSVLSASYSPWNPWRHPWIYRWFESQGWIAY